ncbi:MAG TPA: hypothetical protein VN848_09575 [Gemmatimonadales bacterium]|nr:hypothetical protein [Gemmatimonadales bacterium]
MTAFLYSLLAVALLQGVSKRQSTDTLRPPQDSARSLARARESLARWEAARAHSSDTVAVRLARDSADDALAQAISSFGPPGQSAAGDSARVLRVSEWSTRALDAWTQTGLTAGPAVWGPVPADLRLTPVLEELGENLLRTCPEGGVLLTSDGADFLAAWFMRFARGLRPDLVVTPLSAWEEDGAFRARAARVLGLSKADRHVVEALAERRPVCASMGLAAPPGHLHWRAWPLVWVAGPHIKDSVSPRDFVFAALGVGIAGGDPWAESALAVYDRATRATPALCPALAAFQVAAEPSRCRR